ncbi:MAG: Clp protease ClpP [Neisseriaceae bacterium]|nr:Clp protease ClpP [Neisseriaceae bacterium]
MTKPIAPQNRLSLKSDISLSARQHWQPLALSDVEAINILDEIGDDWWSESDTTLGRVQKKLSAASGADVVVNINSFGGDMFEGLAIYNALRDYSGKVTVKVLGLAASAASIIAMAGDEIMMSEASFLMIHNCWLFAAGNRHDFTALAEQIKPFDDAMASIYSAQTGLSAESVGKMMDAETWINGQSAIDQGFATGLFEAKLSAKLDSQRFAAHKVDTLLAKQGVPRSERRELMREIKGTQNAALGGTQDATLDDDFMTTLKSMVSN